MTALPLTDDRVDQLIGARVIDWFLALGFVAVAGVYVRAIFFTPPELIQGVAQKIYYVHPPSATTAYLAFYIAVIMSVLYLWLRDDRMDRMAEAAGEVALLFTTVAIITGMLWAKPIWGTWWQWEPRLTSVLFLWFLGIGYVVVRSTFDDESLRARYSAVLAVMAGLLIPFIHVSVLLFRSLHPTPIVLTPPGGEPLLPSDMKITFLLSMAGFALLAIGMIRARYRIGMQREAIAELEERR